MTTILSKREAAFIAFLCVGTTAFFSFVTWQMHIKDNIGGLVFGVFFLTFSVGAMICGAIDFIKTIISYRKEKINSKPSTLKVGDCISTNRLNK